MYLLGVDTGGTFTDFVLWDGKQLRVHKVLSTPQAPEQAILQGVRELELDAAPLRLVHGSTVATNATLEGKGVATLYVTNRGFADLLSIGRQNRAELYALQPAKRPPPVAPDWCHETGGRLASDGSLLEPLSDADLEALRATVAERRPAAVAINLLYSWLDPAAEQRLSAALPDGLFVSLSSEVLPEIKEYERGMATWLNAWIGPLVEGYLRRLGEGLPHAKIAVMQSSGDTVAAAQAGAQAVRMLLSGPAGGLVAARSVGQDSGRSRLLTFDMGGTSTDVALIDGEPRLTTQGRIGDYPVAVPMVDMHTIGAGGGSMAWVDEGGMLQVGPRSAGADPGPVCYGKGGRVPTVTDANLVLGRLQADAFLGGRMQLDVRAARRALGDLAGTLNTDVEQLAADIVAVADEHMVRALRTISVGRGVDPRDFTLVCFGGAGGLHVCALAEAMQMRQALMPAYGGVFSALGMLVARPGRQLSRTWQICLQETEVADLDDIFATLAEQGLAGLVSEGHARDQCELQPSLDLRYLGQSYTLNLAWGRDLEAVATAFHQAHERRYGHRLDVPVELVTLRLAVRGPVPQALAYHKEEREPGAHRRVQVSGWPGLAPVLQRAELVVGSRLQGPALICEETATTALAPGWALEVEAGGHLLLTRFE